jgi:hypothetical protein
LPTMAAQALSTSDGEVHRTCPVLENPEPDCYCLDMASLQIHMAIQYCLGNFTQCPIYRRIMGVSEN